MAKSKLVKANKKIEKAVVGGYKAIEEGVVGGFGKMCDGAIGAYTKVEDSFVDRYLTHGDESIEEAKARLRTEQVERERQLAEHERRPRTHVPKV